MAVSWITAVVKPAAVADCCLAAFSSEVAVATPVAADVTLVLRHLHVVVKQQVLDCFPVCFLADPAAVALMIVVAAEPDQAAAAESSPAVPHRLVVAETLDVLTIAAASLLQFERPSSQADADRVGKLTHAAVIRVEALE